MPTPKKASDLRPRATPNISSIPRSSSTPDVSRGLSSIPLKSPSPSLSPSISANNRRQTPRLANTRPQRNENMIHDLRNLTSRVKNMTARVDSRRSTVLPTPSTSIPRARKSSGLHSSINEMPPPPLPALKRPTPLPRASRIDDLPVRAKSPLPPPERARPQSRLSILSTSSRPSTPSGRSPTPTFDRSPEKIPRVKQGKPNGIGFGSATPSGRLPSALPTRPGLDGKRTPVAGLARRVSMKARPFSFQPFPKQEELRDDETF